jgi:hypothetical protein
VGTRTVVAVEPDATAARVAADAETLRKSTSACLSLRSASSLRNALASVPISSRPPSGICAL